MTRRILLISIATGNLKHLTGEAIEALKEIDVVLVADKGEAKDDLVQWRRDVLAHVRGGDLPQVIAVPDPQRGPDAERDAGQYDAGVRDWHAARVDAYEKVLRELPEEAVVGFLVWGDVAYYDSTLRITDALGERLPLDVRVIPGVGAVSLLAAAHRIHLNRIGQPVHVTTGRRLVQEWRTYGEALGDVVVFLDGHLACVELAQEWPDLTIYWGAYLGSEREVLRSGRLGDLAGELVELRAALKAEHGWVMDLYLLRP